MVAAGPAVCGGFHPLASPKTEDLTQFPHHGVGFASLQHPNLLLSSLSAWKSACMDVIRGETWLKAAGEGGEAEIPCASSDVSAVLGTGDPNLGVVVLPALPPSSCWW